MTPNVVKTKDDQAIHKDGENQVRQFSSPVKKESAQKIPLKETQDHLDYSDIDDDGDDGSPKPTGLVRKKSLFIRGDSKIMELKAEKKKQ